MTEMTDQNLDLYIKAALGRKAMGIVALDVRKLTSYTDTLIICSGRSSRQVSAIGDHIKSELKKADIAPLSVEGLNEGQWVLMDYGHVIIHVFYEEARGHYDLEGLWADAERISTKDLEESYRQESDSAGAEQDA